MNMSAGKPFAVPTACQIPGVRKRETGMDAGGIHPGSGCVEVYRDLIHAGEDCGRGCLLRPATACVAHVVAAVWQYDHLRADGHALIEILDVCIQQADAT